LGKIRRGPRQGDRRDWRVARSIFVADDTATARRYVREAGSPYRYYYNNLLTKLLGKGQAILFKQDRDQPDETVTLDHVVDSLVISGTAEEVVDRILALREVIGDFGTILYAGHDWVDPALARRSMELMADNVMPAINRALDDQDQQASAVTGYASARHPCR
jgi:alkanesulfonate monooxygenase SsuD/methylene tetrahydromethanopterin reductase-like flavin-dependent oxidoreductase (luciferase family)